MLEYATTFREAHRHDIDNYTYSHIKPCTKLAYNISFHLVFGFTCERVCFKCNDAKHLVLQSSQSVCVCVCKTERVEIT
jgi:hypothetical protein